MKDNTENLGLALTSFLIGSIILFLLIVAVVERYKSRNFKVRRQDRPVKRYRRVYLRLCTRHFLTRGLKGQLVSLGTKTCDVCQLGEEKIK